MIHNSKATVDVVEPPVSQSSSPESLVTASVVASAMLILSLCYRAPRRWPCAQLSLCHSARSVRPIIRAQAFAAILAQQLKLLARVHKSILLLLSYCTLCHLFAHHQLLVLSLRTCHLAVPCQSSPGRCRPVEALLYLLVCLRTLTRAKSKKKATRDRRLRRAGLDEPVRYRLQITAAPPATRRYNNCSAPA